MWTYFILSAENYFVWVLNSLKSFCLSSEQGFTITEMLNFFININSIIIKILIVSFNWQL